MCSQHYGLPKSTNKAAYRGEAALQEKRLLRFLEHSRQASMLYGSQTSAVSLTTYPYPLRLALLNILLQNCFNARDYFFFVMELQLLTFSIEEGNLLIAFRRCVTFSLK
jgi:hypothetical protein